MFIDPSFIILPVFILESITIMLYCYVDFFREIVVAVDDVGDVAVVAGCPEMTQKSSVCCNTHMGLTF